MLIFIGTTTRGTSRGIYGLRLDLADGSLSEPWLAAEAANPTFLALSPDRRRLYATGEVGTDPAQGGVRAFTLEAGSGRLELINEQAIGGNGTTHVAVSSSGRAVLTANYHAGYVASLPASDDGRLNPPCSRIEHRGPPGPNRERQDRPHPHSVTLSPDNRFALVCDLGLDRVFSYRLGSPVPTLAPNEPPFAEAPAGSGPRHAKFSADGRFFYVANEMGGSVCSYAYNPAAGTLSLRQTISTLPPEFHELNTVGEIRIHPNGRFVYVSNRGHESLAVFARDSVTGDLRLVEIVPCGGRHPRNFDLSPDGRWLLCANRDTDNVVVLSVDPDTGRISPTKIQITVSQPVCVLFAG